MDDKSSTGDNSSSIGKWSVWVAYLSIAGFLIGLVVVLISYFSGSFDSGDGGGFGLMFLASWPFSLIAFVMALVARARKQTVKFLALPLWLFPVLTVLWLLGEFTIFE